MTRRQGDEAVRRQHYPLRLGVPSTWTFGGSITLSNCWVNMAAAKSATARSVSLPVLARSCRSGRERRSLRSSLKHVRRLASALRKQRPQRLQRRIELFIGHRLDAAGGLELHLPRHQ
jgi:hypothetical protein